MRFPRFRRKEDATSLALLAGVIIATVLACAVIREAWPVWYSFFA